MRKIKLKKEKEDKLYKEIHVYVCVPLKKQTRLSPVPTSKPSQKNSISITTLIHILKE